MGVGNLPAVQHTVAICAYNGSSYIPLTCNTSGDLIVSASIGSDGFGPLASYVVSDIDPAGTYFGYLNASGWWYIAQQTIATGAWRYTFGTTGYSTAWTNRATQNYYYFNVALPATY